MMFRALRADEIECRVQQIRQGKKDPNKKYVQLLLYKDARCDQKILDETVGEMNWQRKHSEHNGNLFCSIGIYDSEKKEWVWKEDAGTESNMEAKKGHASDSFKRAGTNWGIGRELYTRLKIFFELNDGEFFEKNGKIATNESFYVKSIFTENETIEKIEIADKHGCVRWKK